MAAVYKKTTTRRLPDGAELFVRKGQQMARWQLKNGTKRTAPVTIGKDGSQRIATEASTYTAKYRDGKGIVREVATVCRSKDGAQAVLKELSDRAERVHSGIVSQTDDAVRDWLRLPISDSFENYIAAVESRDTSPVYVQNLRYLAGRLFDDCRWKLLCDLSADSLNGWLAKRRTEGMGARARNQYLQVAKQFAGWCVVENRLAANPLDRVAKADEQADQRRQRRAMTASELERLLYVARWRPLAEYGRTTEAKPEGERKGKRDTWNLAPLTFNELPQAIERGRERLRGNPELVAKLEATGRERQLIYKTLVLTGLRRGELGSLTVGSLVLDVPTPFAILEAKNAKNRERSEVPLRGDLANELAQWIANRNATSRTVLPMTPGGKGGANSKGGLGSGLVPFGPQESHRGEKLFNVPPQLIKVFNADIAAAGIAKADDRGRTLDVHALRHSFGSLLSAGGVAPRTAQAAMRHSTIDLTMNVYTDPRVLDVAGALDSLPSLPLDAQPSGHQQRQIATGTDHATARGQFLVAPLVAPNSGKLCKLGATTDNQWGRTQSDGHEKTPRKQAVSRGFVKRRRPDSNRGCRICNPMP